MGRFINDKENDRLMPVSGQAGAPSSTVDPTDLNPLQTKVIAEGLSDKFEVLGEGSLNSYNEGDIVFCDNGKWYEASAAIAVDDVLEVGTNLIAKTQREMNTGVAQQLRANGIPFRFGYDPVSGKYGYIINQGGADTVIPFSSGGGIPNLLSSAFQSTSRGVNGVTNNHTVETGKEYTILNIQSTVFAYVSQAAISGCTVKSHTTLVNLLAYSGIVVRVAHVVATSTTIGYTIYGTTLNTDAQAYNCTFLYDGDVSLENLFTSAS